MNINIPVTSDTHRVLGNGERVQWGDLKSPYGNWMLCTKDDIGTIVHEDMFPYARPIIRETAPHIFDERNAPKISVMPDAPLDTTNWGWPEQPGSKVEVEPEKAKTFDDGKPPLAQVPWAAVKEMASVQLYGHKKYGDFYNYRKGMEVSRNLSCAIRHIAAYMDGEDLDPESQCSHLGHAMCRVAFVLQNMQDGTLIDDRYGKEAAK